MPRSCPDRLRGSGRRPSRRRRFRRSLLVVAPATALCLMVMPLCLAAGGRPVLSTAGASLLDAARVPLAFGREQTSRQPFEPFQVELDLEPTLATWQPPSGDLLERYRKALERECRRSVDRKPALSWSEAPDFGREPEAEARREAEKVFSGANNRVLSHFLERMVSDAAALRTARAYLGGIRLDVARGGGVRVGVGGDEEPAATSAARFTFVGIGNPRIEMRSRLPGAVRARLELSLGSPGFRATLTRKLAPGISGRIGGGVEDSGEDRWVSAGLEIRF